MMTLGDYLIGEVKSIEFIEFKENDRGTSTSS